MTSKTRRRARPETDYYTVARAVFDNRDVMTAGSNWVGVGGGGGGIRQTILGEKLCPIALDSSGN